MTSCLIKAVLGVKPEALPLLLEYTVRRDEVYLYSVLQECFVLLALHPYTPASSSYAALKEQSQNQVLLCFPLKSEAAHQEGFPNPHSLPLAPIADTSQSTEAGLDSHLTCTLQKSPVVAILLFLDFLFFISTCFLNLAAP